MNANRLQNIGQVQRRLREVTMCPSCRKSTIVLDVIVGRRVEPELVTRETHCTCPGGPAAHLGKEAQ